MWHAWERGKVFRGVRLGGPKVRDYWEDLGVGGRIRLAQDRVQWRAFVNTVMNLRVP